MANTRKFSSGWIVATPGVLDLFGDPLPESILHCLRRHLSGDWGDIDAEDKKLNDRGVKEGGRVLSSYNFPQGTPSCSGAKGILEVRKVWIITECDRSVTTILLPSEY